MDDFADSAAAAGSLGAEGMLTGEPIWSWEQDRHYRTTHVIPIASSPAFDPRRTVGRTRWELPGAQPVRGSWVAHRELLAERLPFHDLRYLVQLRGEAPRCFIESGEPLFDGGGAFRGYRGTTRDVTRAWLQERRLQETESLLQVAARLARFGAWSVDVATGEARWSPQDGLLHLGRGGQAPLRELLPNYAPEYRALLQQAYERCAREGRPFDVEVQALTAHGGRLWLRVLGAAVRDANGAIVRVQGAYQDIHKSKRAAEEQREAAQRFRTTLDSLADGFLVLDRQWRITYANPASEAILGLPVQEMVGRGMWEVFPAGEHGAFGDHYRRSMYEGRVCRFEACYPPLSMWFRVSAFPSREGIAISFTDITATRQLHERLLHANAELERRVAERTGQLRRAHDELAEFTVAVAHDLRAPLAGIAGFSRAVADALRDRGDERLGHLLSRIRAGVGRMEDLLDALLELSRVGRGDLQPRRVDLTAVAHCTVEALRASEPGRDAQVQVQPGLQAWGDARLLRTLMENLLGNAWKFSAGREPAHIVVGQRGDGTFFVCDNGPGFDAARAGEVFAPFRRLHADGEFAGLGMGLASARRVVERHGGRIWAEPVPGEGAVFCFTLPAEGEAR